MIAFRCWYCNKRYTVAEARVGERITCTCRYALRVPKRNGGNSRVKTPTDWLVEVVVYGGGGALLGCGLAVLILSQLPRLMGRGGLFEFAWALVGGLTLLGFLFGTFGGERGINWVGRMIRDREER
ncbi:MAG TPA: hypothetical protein VFE78_05210 [Gemmataceae bacterium]|jgi:hypothetical protein|nr:hypothetical protein [Gemmataceae bacterium]